MPKTLADINATLGSADAAELTRIIADIKASIRVSDAGVIADAQAAAAVKEAELSDIKAVVAEATKVILDDDISDEDTVLALKAKIEAQTVPGKLAALDAQIAELQAKRDALLGGAVPVADEEDIGK